MKKFSYILALTVACSLIFPLSVSAQSLPAFPGAEGFGSSTKGGRGGQVIEVTNLNDSGPGSFRDAVEVKTGPRIVIFKTGGIIQAATPINIINPFITIAGQTAPGGGIVITGSPLKIKTHDVIVRGLRFRIGDGPGTAADGRDGIALSGYDNQEVYNVIIDHNSVAWAVDENITSWDNSVTNDKVHDVTFSWNISTEALYCSIHDSCHSMGLLIGDHSKNVSVHHNLLASNGDRNPRIPGGTKSEVINNVVYNWDSNPTAVSGGAASAYPIFANIIGNFYKATANGNSQKGTNYGIEVQCDIATGSKIYLKGNIGDGRLVDSGDEWSGTSLCNTLNSTVKSLSPVLSATGGVTTTTALDAYDKVLENAGAVFPTRDSIDLRAVNTTKNGTSPVSGGKWMVDSPSEVGGMPQYPAGTAQQDSDHDGIPDSFEQSNGGNLNPSQTSSSGYTWMEEYINSLIPTVSVGQSPTPAGKPSGGVKPGDANDDNVVDGIDYVVWLNNYNQNKAGASNGDFDGNGFVDGIDYVIWLNNYGQ